MEVPRDKLDLKDDPGVLSPPIVDPAWQCASVVAMHGFVAEATLDVEVDGVVVILGAPGGFPLPNGAVLQVPAPLKAGQVLRARQSVGGATSDWSAEVRVRDHTLDFPAGPPRPQINPAPVYRCGRRTGVGNLLLGSEVWITADAVEVGRAPDAKTQQGVNVAPPYGLGQSVIAFASLCNDPSPPSVIEVSQPPPIPLAAPGIESTYTGSQQITVTNVVNGGLLTLSRNGVVQFSFASWGIRHLVTLSPPLSAGETLAVSQQLCPGDPPSVTTTTTVAPCSALPAPGVDPIQAGDTTVTLTSFVSDARVKVFVNGVKTGEGAGPMVALTRAVARGDTVDVLQVLGACVGSTVQELTVQCVAPPVGFDPTALDLFPVGVTSYNAGPLTVTSGHTQNVAGTVHYPADTDGIGTPFNTRLAALGRVPVAVLVHGRHGGTTSHLGYDYLQDQLARMGIVAVSVDCNESDQWGGWADNIRDRADLIIASIAHLQSLDAGGDPLFGGRLDLGRLAMMGHSRGGDAVVVVPEIITLPGVVVKGVISLGPVNSGASSGHPKGYPFLAILPASDGDVIDNNGAQFYDAADPSPFKAQLYIDHANHNFFNRQWLNDDTGGGLPLMSRQDHERILSAYGCAFFRRVLLGHATEGFLDGTLRPPSVLTADIHLSFKRQGQVTVDDHEDGNGITKNSFSAPTAASGGLLADEHPFRQAVAGRFNDTFFGDTVGMVAQVKERSGTFRSAFDQARDLTETQVWIRAAEVYDGVSVPAAGTGFQLGLEDDKGTVVWVDSDGVGGIPRPLDRRAYDLTQWYATDKTKTMPTTLRFPAGCFSPPVSVPFDPRRVIAIQLRLDRGDRRALAFDDLQLVQS
jgi:hypothetical protein